MNSCRPWSARHHSLGRAKNKCQKSLAAGDVSASRFLPVFKRCPVRWIFSLAHLLSSQIHLRQLTTCKMKFVSFNFYSSFVMVVLMLMLFDADVGCCSFGCRGCRGLIGSSGCPDPSAHLEQRVRHEGGRQLLLFVSPNFEN